MKTSKKNKASDLSQLKAQLDLIATELEQTRNRIRTLQEQLGKTKTKPIPFAEFPFMNLLCDAFCRRSQKSRSAPAYKSTCAEAIEQLINSYLQTKH